MDPSDPSNLLTNPINSWYPGNIYHAQESNEHSSNDQLSSTDALFIGGAFVLLFVVLLWAMNRGL